MHERPEDNPYFNPQSTAEELANTLTHAVGLLLSILGFKHLWALSWSQGVFPFLVCNIYATTLVLLFLSSTLYHACWSPLWKDRGRLVDHCAIYLLIGGSYAPFLLLGLRGWLGWLSMALVVVMTIYGIRRKLVKRELYGPKAVIPYLINGWVLLLIWSPLSQALSSDVLNWLMAGAFFYCGGIVFYAWRGLTYSHAIWHLFVILGAGSHFGSVYKLVAN